MKYFETESVELKRNLNDTFEKEVVAFLNTHDGVIYIGIEDDGLICGVEKIDETMKKISDIISTRILPNPQELINVSAKYEDGKFIIYRKSLKEIDDVDTDYVSVLKGYISITPMSQTTFNKDFYNLVKSKV